MSENNSLVDVLVDARLEARQVKTLDRTWKLRTEDEGYQTMFLVSERLGWQQAGWKIAATNLQVQQQLRTDSPVFGPIFQNHIVQSPAMIAYERLLSPIVECE